MRKVEGIKDAQLNTVMFTVQFCGPICALETSQGLAFTCENKLKKHL